MVGPVRARAGLRAGLPRAHRLPGLARQFRDCDLIAGRWPLVIACEVRARRIIEPVHDERSSRRKRLRRSASIWLANPANRGFQEVRFDRIDVYLSHGGELTGSSTTPMRSRKPDRPLRGDEGELFRRHHGRLVRLVQRDVGAPEAVAEDAVCFAFLQLCRRQPERSDRTVGWLRVVARHEALRLLRNLWSNVPLDKAGPGRPELVGEPIPLVERIAGPVDVELASEARDALRALAGLRWLRRRVLALKAAGYSYEEIGEVLGVTYTNVNRHLTRARTELNELRRAA
jgi:RNA polymerase sigma factor (sigma-70 family)